MHYLEASSRYAKKKTGKKNNTEQNFVQYVLAKKVITLHIHTVIQFTHGRSKTILCTTKIYMYIPKLLIE